MTTQISIIPILEDNYAYLLRGADGTVAVADPGEAGPIIAYCEENDIAPDLIINTHHHWDHTDGNPALRDKYGCRTAAPKGKIDPIDIVLSEDQGFDFDGETVQILHTPGHTLDHICLYFPDSGFVLTGDALFAMGCGRLFEGTAAMLFDGFKKLRALPDDTAIYCGHEYTLANAKFCAHAAPDNADILKRLKKVQAKRDKGEITIPSTIAEEESSNVFFMAKTALELAELRDAKDNF